MLDWEFYRQKSIRYFDGWDNMRSRPCCIRNTALRIIQGDVYFFNDHDIYEKCSLEKATRRHIDGIFHYQGGARVAANIPVIYRGNGSTIRMAAARADEGTTWAEFVDLWESLHLKPRQKIDTSGVNGVVSKIATPKIERAVGNNNKDTFDFIRVEVGLIGDRDKQKAGIEEYIDEIGEQVLDKIEKSKNFQKFGVPVNILRIGNIVWRNDGALEYTFEVKDK